MAAVREDREMSGKKKIGQGIREMSGNFKVDQGKIKGKRICNLKKNIYKKLFCIKKNI